MFYRSSNRRQFIRILNLTLMLFGSIASVALIDHIANQSTASANSEIRSHAGNNPTHMRDKRPVRTSASDALGRLPLTGAV